MCRPICVRETVKLEEADLRYENAKSKMSRWGKAKCEKLGGGAKWEKTGVGVRNGNLF